MSIVSKRFSPGGRPPFQSLQRRPATRAANANARGAERDRPAGSGQVLPRHRLTRPASSLSQQLVGASVCSRTCSAIAQLMPSSRGRRSCDTWTRLREREPVQKYGIGSWPRSSAAVLCGFEGDCPCRTTAPRGPSRVGVRQSAVAAIGSSAPDYWRAARSIATGPRGQKLCVSGPLMATAMSSPFVLGAAAPLQQIQGLAASRAQQCRAQQLPRAQLAERTAFAAEKPARSWPSVW